jgi:Secretion system C-terminal sorting domain
MKKTFTLLAFSLTCFVTDVNAQFHAWTKLNEGDINGGEAHPEFVRANENTSSTVIHVGRFAGTIDFDPTATVSAVSTLSNDIYSNNDWYIQKLDLAGNVLWTRFIQMDDAQDNLEIIDVEIDDDGGVVLVANFIGGFDVNPGAVTNVVNSIGPDENMLILKLNAGGVFYFEQHFESSVALGVEISATDIYVAGEIYGTVDLDYSSGTVENVTSNLGSKIIITLGGNGTYYSNILLEGYPLGNFGFHFNYDSNSFYVFGGLFGSTVDFDFGPGSSVVTPSPSLREYFVAQISSLTGGFEDVHIINTTAPSYINSTIAQVDIKYGKMYFAGEFTNDIDFETSTPAVSLSTTSGSEREYLACIDLSSFSLLWAKKFETTNVLAQDPSDLKVAFNSNKIYLNTNYVPVGTDLSGNGTDVLTASKDVITIFDKDGNYLGKKEYSAFGGPNKLAVLDNYEELFAAGYYTNTIFDLNPDAGTFIPSSENGGFISRFSATNIAGLETKSTDLCSIYPNPATSTISIEGLSLENTSYSIQTIAGSVVANGSVSENNPISIEALPTGIYFLQIEINHINQSIRFIKQ